MNQVKIKGAVGAKILPWYAHKPALNHSPGVVADSAL